MWHDKLCVCACVCRWTWSTHLERVHHWGQLELCCGENWNSPKTRCACEKTLSVCVCAPMCNHIDLPKPSRNSAFSSETTSTMSWVPSFDLWGLTQSAAASRFATAMDAAPGDTWALATGSVTLPNISRNTSCVIATKAGQGRGAKTRRARAERRKIDLSFFVTVLSIYEFMGIIILLMEVTVLSSVVQVHFNFISPKVFFFLNLLCPFCFPVQPVVNTLL